MHESLAVIIPPLLTLCIALTTRRVALSLACGCFAASYIGADFSFLGGLHLMVSRILQTTELGSCCSWQALTEANNMQISIFVIVMGILIVAIEHSGSYAAFNIMLNNKINNKKHAEVAAVALTHCVAIDGYLAMLTVGSIMRPIFDQYSAARLKLAFIVRSLSLALCAINPISTWIALILLQLHLSGVTRQQLPHSLIQADPFIVYFGSLPFVFYSLLTLASVWMVVGRQFSFGSMARFENEHWTAPANRSPVSPTTELGNPHILDIILPIVSLVFFTFICFLYTGGWWFFGGTLDLRDALQEIAVAPSLLGASLMSLFFYFAYCLSRGILLPRALPKIIWKGLTMMLPAIIVLNLAWTLATMETNNHALDKLMAEWLPQSLPAWLLPFFYFSLAAAISTATGSSWATIGLLFPIGVSTVAAFAPHPFPLHIEETPLLFPIIGAILSGAVCGDALSPISDLSIVVSASSRCKHADHTTTQMTYATPVVICSGLAFLISGVVTPYHLVLGALVPLAIALSCCGIYYFWRQHEYSKTNAITYKA